MGFIKASDRLPERGKSYLCKDYRYGPTPILRVYHYPKRAGHGSSSFERHPETIYWFDDSEECVLDPAIQLIRDIRHGNIYKDPVDACANFLIEHGYETV